MTYFWYMDYYASVFQLICWEAECSCLPFIPHQQTIVQNTVHDRFIHATKSVIIFPPTPSVLTYLPETNVLTFTLNICIKYNGLKMFEHFIVTAFVAFCFYMDVILPLNITNIRISSAYINL